MTTDSIFFPWRRKITGRHMGPVEIQESSWLAFGENDLTAAGNEPAERFTWEPRPEAKASFSICGYELYDTEE